ncbi:MAG: DUF1232 domain-containing protein [Ignavibacteria bacterium]|nr:DUF1232 domain-containing protein [Ignavibacteria bacterium]
MKNNLTTDSYKSDDNTMELLQDYYPTRPLTRDEELELGTNVDHKIVKNKKSIFKIISHLKALKRYMMAKDVKWYRKSVVIAALVYFVMPLDVMPDFAPLLGYLDDIGVVAWTIKFLGNEVTSYYD